MSIYLMKGINLMTTFTIRYNEMLHRKLKVIAAYENKSLNNLIIDFLLEKANDWENMNNQIKINE